MLLLPLSLLHLPSSHQARPKRSLSVPMDYLPSPIEYLQHTLEIERDQAFRLLAVIASSLLVAGAWFVSNHS